MRSHCWSLKHVIDAVWAFCSYDALSFLHSVGRTEIIFGLARVAPEHVMNMSRDLVADCLVLIVCGKNKVRIEAKWCGECVYKHFFFKTVYWDGSTL